jgi:hypothetical protein
MLVLPADLPMLRAPDVGALLEEVPEEGPAVVVSPDAEGTGTNALLLRPPDVAPFLFGTGSFEAHGAAAREAGARVRVLTRPGLAFDLDTAEDLRRLEGRGEAGRQAVPARSAEGVRVLPVALPHWRGPGECLHLMSLVSPVAPDLAVVFLPLIATAFVEEMRRRGWGFVEVPDEEFDSLGCNALALAPNRVVVCDGNPVTRARLEAAGCEVIAYAGQEISVNRAGGPTCLTRPIWRQD